MLKSQKNPAINLVSPVVYSPLNEIQNHCFLPYCSALEGRKIIELKSASGKKMSNGRSAHLSVNSDEPRLVRWCS